MPQAVGALVAAAAKLITTKVIVGIALASAAVALAVDVSLRGRLKSQSFKTDNDLRRESVVRSAIAPRNIVLGKTLVGGVLTYMNTGGESNKDMWMVIAHAGHRVNAIQDMWLYDAFVGAEHIDWNGSVTGGKYHINDESYAGFYRTLGESDQGTIAPLVQNFSDLGPNHRGRGVAFTASKLTLDKESENVFEAGAPQNLRALIEGTNEVYDPRLDTSPGANPTNTNYQVYTTNPILLAAWYATNTDVGAGRSFSKVDWQVIADEADYCDVMVPNSIEGGREKRFTCNGFLTTGDEHKDNIDAILSSCNGRRSVVSGKIHLRAGRFGIGSNLVTNGAFESNVDGWALGSSGAVQAVTTVPGNVYYFRAVVGDSTSASDSYQLAKSDNPDGSSPTDLSSVVSGYDKNLYLRFTATAAVSYICLNSTLAAADSFIWSDGKGLLEDTSGNTAAFDGVECYLVSDIGIDVDWLRGDIAVQTSIPKADRFNTARGFYVNRDEDYKKVEALEVTNTAFVSRDNGEKIYRSFEFPTTDHEDEAQRLLHKRIQQTDEPTIVRLPCNFKALSCAMHGYVRLTIEEMGWTDKIFRVINWKFNGTGDGVDLTVKEDSVLGYEDPDREDYSVRTPSGGVTVGLPEVPEPTSPTLTAMEGGLLVEWTNPRLSQYFDTVEVFAGPTSSFGAATKVDEKRGESHFIPLDNGEELYTFVRSRKGSEYSTEVATTPNNATAANALAAAAQTANYSQIIDDESYLIRLEGSLDFQTEDGGIILDESNNAVVNETTGDVAIVVSGVQSSIVTIGETIAGINTSLASIQTTLVDLTSGVSSVFVRPEKPVAGVDGIPDPIPEFSRWYDEDDDNKPHYWNGSDWVDLSDPRVATNEANIVTLQSSLTSAQSNISANSSAISTLDATVASNTSNIATISNQTTALESDLTKLEDENGDILSGEDDALFELELPGSIAAASSAATRALDARVIVAENSISSIASDVTVLQSSITAAETNITANANSTSALSSRVTANENSLSAQATSITSLNTSVGEHTSTLTAYGTSINGLRARWGFLVDINGRITGIEQSSTATESSMAIITDQFSLVDPDDDGNEQVPFLWQSGTLTVQNLTVNGSLVVNGSISTNKIASGAISAHSFVNEGSSVVVLSSNTTRDTVNSITIDTTDAIYCRITVSGLFSGYDKTGSDIVGTVEPRLRRGVSDIIQYRPTIDHVALSNINGAVSGRPAVTRENFVYLDQSPLSGSTTYTFEARQGAGSSPVDTELRCFAAIAIEIMKR